MRKSEPNREFCLTIPHDAVLFPSMPKNEQPSKTKISVTMDDKLLSIVDSTAIDESRSLSMMVCILIREALDARRGKEKP